MKSYIYLFVIAITGSIALSAQLSASQSLVFDKGNTGGSGGGPDISMAAIYSDDNSISVSIIQGTGVDVSFTSDLNIISINIKDSNGFTVYNESVDTSVTNQLFIDTFNLPTGVYTINFLNANNNTIKNTSLSVE